MSQYCHDSVFNLYLKNSQIPNGGLGVFTKDHIPPSMLIGEYTGKKHTRTAGGSYVLAIDDTCFIDALNFPRSFMAMLNDCSHIAKQTMSKKKKRIDATPEAYYDAHNTRLAINCKFVIDSINKRAFVYSMCEIKPDSELFVSYGEDYWK